VSGTATADAGTQRWLGATDPQTAAQPEGN